MILISLGIVRSCIGIQVRPDWLLSEIPEVGAFGNVVRSWVMGMGDAPLILWANKSEPETAQAEMTKRWGITEFARSPFGGWGDATFVKARLKELMALPLTSTAK